MRQRVDPGATSFILQKSDSLLSLDFSPMGRKGFLKRDPLSGLPATLRGLSLIPSGAPGRVQGTRDWQGGGLQETPASLPGSKAQHDTDTWRQTDTMGSQFSRPGTSVLVINWFWEA